jgi:hypothetical protein
VLARPAHGRNAHVPICRTVGWSLRGEPAQSFEGVLSSDGSFTILAAFNALVGLVGLYIHDNSDGGYGGDDFCYGVVNEIVCPACEQRAVQSLVTARVW